MPLLTFELIKKTFRARVDDAGVKQILTFIVRFEQRERLLTSAGELIKYGYIEFVLDESRTNSSQLLFTTARKDTEFGDSPPSISFYALLPPDLFDVVRNADKEAKTILHIQMKDFDGAIRYGYDPDGYEKVWDVDRENPVRPESFEIEISHATQSDT